MQAGFSAHHLFEPEQSLIGKSALLPRKYTAHMGVNIPLERGRGARHLNSYISPQIIYQQQRDFNELNLGVFVKKGALTGGLWYRTRDAIIASIAIQTKHFRVGYSYDATLSNLSVASVGSHEIAIGYTFQCRIQNKKPKRMACPGWG